MKFGRQPRGFDPRIPHYSAIKGMRSKKFLSLADLLPVAVHYGATLPATGLGMFLNDQLGDCTCAGIYHAFQVWQNAACPPMDQEPDSNVKLLYEEACGYVDGNPKTDQGGMEQGVLQYVNHIGAPYGSGQREKIDVYVEIDTRNQGDVKEGIWTAGLVYIGFDVPTNLDETPGSTWDATPSIGLQGGHCVIACGYDAAGLDIISWGSKYRMTWAFWDAHVDECYALGYERWVTSTGKTPGGLVWSDLLAQMNAIAEAA